MSSSVTAWMRNMTVGAWVPLAGSPAAQNLSLSFEADGDAFRLWLSLHAERPRLMQEVTIRRQLAHSGTMFASSPWQLPVPRSASIHVYDGLTLAGHRLRLDRLAAMPALNFLPLGFAHSSREPRKLPTGILRCATVLKDAPSLVSGLSVAIETATVMKAEKQDWE